MEIPDKPSKFAKYEDVLVQVFDKFFKLSEVRSDEFPREVYRWELGGITDPLGQLIAWLWLECISPAFEDTKSTVYNYLVSVRQAIEERLKETSTQLGVKLDSTYFLSSQAVKKVEETSTKVDVVKTIVEVARKYIEDTKTRTEAIKKFFDELEKYSPQIWEKIRPALLSILPAELLASPELKSVNVITSGVLASVGTYGVLARQAKWLEHVKKVSDEFCSRYPKLCEEYGVLTIKRRPLGIALPTIEGWIADTISEIQAVTTVEVHHTHETVQDVKKTVEDTKKKVEETGKKVEETKEVIEDTKRKVEETRKEIEETRKEVEETRKTTQTIVHAVPRYLEELLPRIDGIIYDVRDIKNLNIEALRSLDEVEKAIEELQKRTKSIDERTETIDKQFDWLQEVIKHIHVSVVNIPEQLPNLLSCTLNVRDRVTKIDEKIVYILQNIQNVNKGVEETKQKVEEGWKALEKQLQEAIQNFIKSLPPIFQPVVQGIVTVVDMFVSGLKTVASMITSAFSDFAKWIWEKLPPEIKNAIQGLQRAWETLVSGLREFLRDPTKWFQDRFKELSQWVWEHLPQEIKQAWIGLQKAWETFVQGLQDFLRDPAKWIQDRFKELSKWIWEHLPSELKHAWLDLQKAFDEFRKGFEWFSNKVKEFFEWLQREWQEFTRDPWGYIKEKIIGGFWTWLTKEAIPGLIKWFREEALPTIKSVLSAILQGLRDFAQELYGVIVKPLEPHLKSLFSSFYAPIVTPLTEGIVDVLYEELAPIGIRRVAERGELSFVLRVPLRILLWALDKLSMLIYAESLATVLKSLNIRIGIPGTNIQGGLDIGQAVRTLVREVKEFVRWGLFGAIAGVTLMVTEPLRELVDMNYRAWFVNTVKQPAGRILLAQLMPILTKGILEEYKEGRFVPNWTEIKWHFATWGIPERWAKWLYESAMEYPSMTDLRELFALGKISREEMIVLTRRRGYHPDLVHKMLYTVLKTPTETMLELLVQREMQLPAAFNFPEFQPGAIEEGATFKLAVGKEIPETLASTLEKWLKMEGYLPEIADEPMRSYYAKLLRYKLFELAIKPTVRDLIEFMIRDVFPHLKQLQDEELRRKAVEIYKTYGLYDFLWLATAKGLAPIWAFAYFEQHWKLIPPDAVADLFFWGIIDAQAYQRYMVFHDYRPIPRVPFSKETTTRWGTAQKYHVPTPWGKSVWASDTVLRLISLYEIPLRIDTRWMIRWGIYSKFHDKPELLEKITIPETPTVAGGYVDVIKKLFGDNFVNELKNVLRTLWTSSVGGENYKDMVKKSMFEMYEILLERRVRPDWVPAIFTAEWVNNILDERTRLVSEARRLLREGLISIQDFVTMFRDYVLISVPEKIKVPVLATKEVEQPGGGKTIAPVIEYVEKEIPRRIWLLNPDEILLNMLQGLMMARREALRRRMYALAYEYTVGLISDEELRKKISEIIVNPIVRDAWLDYVYARKLRDHLYYLHRVLLRYTDAVLDYFEEGWISESEAERLIKRYAGKFIHEEHIKIMLEERNIRRERRIKRNRMYAIINKLRRGVISVDEAIQELMKLGLDKETAEATVERYARVYTVSPATLASMMEYIPIPQNFFEKKVKAIGMPEDEIKLYRAYAFARVINSEARRYITELINAYAEGVIDRKTLEQEIENIRTLWGKVKELFGVDWILISPEEKEFLLKLADLRRTRRLYR